MIFLQQKYFFQILNIYYVLGNKIYLLFFYFEYFQQPAYILAIVFFHQNILFLNIL